MLYKINLFMKLVKSSISFLLTVGVFTKITAQCSGGDSDTSLALEEEEIYLNNEGNVGSSRDPDMTSYTPNDTRIGPGWLSGIWLGGLNEDRELQLNAATFQGFGNNCFWPGPVNDGSTNTTNTEVCEDWDLFFQTSKEDISAFREDFDDNGILDNPIPLSIQGWPGIGNPLFLEIHGFSLPAISLAPFTDNNGDGLYNPTDGDFPNINNADNGIWWVLQTNGHVNVCNGSDNLNLEIHILAKQYDVFNESIFYDFDFHSRDEEVIDSLFFSFWLTVNSFCNNALIGSKPEENFAFFYEPIDSLTTQGCFITGNIKPTILGVKQLQGPLAPRVFNENNELVYPNLGMSADTFVEQRMSAVKHYFRNSPTTTTFESDPGSPSQYYNMMQGKWRDGSDQLINGEVSAFAFPGNPANQEEGDFAMCNEERRIEDIRATISCGPFRVEPGSEHKLSYVVTRAEYDSSQRCADISLLENKLEEIENFNFDEIFSQTEPIMERNTNIKVLVQPNPVSNQTSFLLTQESEFINTIQIYNLFGNLVLSFDIQNQVGKAVSLNLLSEGTYIYIVTSDKGNNYTGKFVKL